ncbi:hypothetical protein SADUNF_Sadunf04G0013400 [Salix dunnii]|uniref:Gnk2-homologous domain-containing protein n=1 Tax=Salix dunnii TaxID=1413687 RepID=A0A835N2J6_9ROSI|nr:hypothetical protein SADUNF_Sadunf04G0013400 [Salix dunnii]
MLSKVGVRILGAKMNSLIKFSTIILLYLLTLSVITQAQSLNNPNYIHHICDDATTSTTTYKDNLNLLLSSLASNATRNSIGFFNASEGREPDDVYGHFFCRGDLSTDVCQNCVANATKDIVQRRCPTQMAALIWYDECFLRYSNKIMFSIMERDPPFTLMNPQSLAVHADFNRILVDTIGTAVYQAANMPAGARKFAATKANYTKQDMLYVLVQCTPDLSSNDCHQCLLSAYSGLQVCCNEKRGGRILFPSFEEAAVLAPSPVQQGDKGSKKKTWIIIGATLSTIVGVLLFSSFAYTMWRRKKREESQNSQVIQLLDLEGDDYSNEIIYGEVKSQDSPLIRLDIVLKATNQFSNENKLGQGGFGPVYKAWKLWSEGKGLELMDSLLDMSSEETEVLKCIHIGLLCVQEDPADRPTMSSVVVMLAGDNSTIPIPTQPAFSVGRIVAEESTSSKQRVLSSFNEEVTLSIGILCDGKEVAVKRLSTMPEQDTK